MPRRKEVRGEQEKWETARRDAWLRELLTDSSKSEPEDEYTRFKESSKWIAKMTGGAAEAGPEGTRGANSEDFTGEPGAPHEALKRRPGAGIEDTACLTQGKSSKV
jgi:hypothetical protein